jgi:hypothetical protein
MWGLHGPLALLDMIQEQLQWVKSTEISVCRVKDIHGSGALNISLNRLMPCSVGDDLLREISRSVVVKDGHPSKRRLILFRRDEVESSIVIHISNANRVRIYEVGVDGVTNPSAVSAIGGSFEPDQAPGRGSHIEWVFGLTHHDVHPAVAIQITGAIGSNIEVTARAIRVVTGITGTDDVYGPLAGSRIPTVFARVFEPYCLVRGGTGANNIDASLSGSDI